MLTGKNGQLGSILLQKLTHQDVIGLSRLELDFLKPQDVSKVLEYYQPDIILNAAAYTAVDKAESEDGLAFQVNADTVYEIAQYANRHDILLYHYSTDYVFDGELNQPYTETDMTNPINIYGKSKLAGEQAIIASGCRYCIFRSSWIYSITGHHFIKTILQLLFINKDLQIVDDQIGSPISANLIADVSLMALNKNLSSGLYHLSTGGYTTRFELARYAAAFFYGEEVLKKIKPITSVNYSFIAKRPRNSRLNTDKLEQALMFKLPQWQDEFNHFFENFKNKLWFL